MSLDVRIENLNVWYGKNHILRDVSFTAPNQKITALIGPSGCGKSTLIRSINRTNELITKTITTGNIWLGETDYRSYDVLDLRAKVGIIFQKPIALPTSIYENVAVGPRLFGRKAKTELDGMVERSLKQAALWPEVKDRLKEDARRLSGGQKQRLAIARALAMEPEIILFDEATASLDPISTQAIEDLLDSLKARATIIMVTHNMQQAARVSDYTLFMMACDCEPAMVVEVDQTAKIFTLPSKPETERYITGRFG